MNRYVLLSFAFMGWAFYELSGGADFEPRSRTEPVELRKTASATAPAPSANRTTQPAAPVVLAAARPAPEPAATTPVAVPTVQRRPQAGLVGVTAPTPAAQRVAISAPEPQSAPEPRPSQDLRQVTGNRVNMRGGPGTAYSVLATLTRGDQVIVLHEPGNGWAKLRVLETGRIGWMSVRMLRPALANP